MLERRLKATVLALAFVGVCASLGTLAGGLRSPVAAQDITTDLALFLKGTHPRVAVTVDAATTFAVSGRFGWAYVLLACTGAESIDTITGGTTGMLLFIEHTDTDCTLNDDADATAADALALTGAATDVGAVEKMLVLIYNGSYWLELAESDN